MELIETGLHARAMRVDAFGAMRCARCTLWAAAAVGCARSGECGEQVMGTLMPVLDPRNRDP